MIPIKYTAYNFQDPMYTCISCTFTVHETILYLHLATTHCYTNEVADSHTDCDIIPAAKTLHKPCIYKTETRL